MSWAVSSRGPCGTTGAMPLSAQGTLRRAASDEPFVCGNTSCLKEVADFLSTRTFNNEFSGTKAKPQSTL